MIWWPLFFLPFIQADERSVAKYCFHTSAKMERALDKLKTIAVPVDEIEQDHSCLVISTRPYRRELLQKFLLAHNPDMSVVSSHLMAKQAPCELHVERVKLPPKQNRSNAPEKAEKELPEPVLSKENSHITTLKEFELMVGHTRVQGECKSIRPDLYEVTLMLQQEGASPALPLIKKIQLKKDAMTNLGEIVDELKQSHTKTEKNDVQERILLGIH